MDLLMRNKAYGRQIYAQVMSEACVYSTHLDHDAGSGVTPVLLRLIPHRDSFASETIRLSSATGPLDGGVENLVD